MVDIIAHRYGVLPSEVSKLSWYEIMVCIKCVQARSKRLRGAIRQSTRKKGAIFPNVSLSDIIDMI